MVGSAGGGAGDAAAAWVLAAWPPILAWLQAAGGGGAGAEGLPPAARWVAIGALALVALYLLTTAVRCLLRLVGLALLVAGAWLAWRWLG